MLAAFLVTTPLDLVRDDNNQLVPAAGSLRAHVLAANNNDEGDTITFAPNVTSISLNGGEIEITGQQQNDSSLQILGPSPTLLTIVGGAGERIFNIHDDGFMSIVVGGMTLTNGRAFGADDAGLGGAIFNTEDLTLVEVVLAGNTASRGGGAIFHDLGNLRISRSLIQGNSAGAAGGGGVLMGKAADSGSSEETPRATIIDSTFTGNAANGEEAFGGGIFNVHGTMTIRQSTIVGNTASMGGGVASQGNPIAEGADSEMPPDPLPDPPAPNVFTFIGSSIIWMNEGNDVDRVGMSTGDTPIDLLPSIFAPAEMPGDPPMPGTLGYNFVGTGNATTAGEDFAFMSTGDMVGVDPELVSDDMGNPILTSYGGVTPVFMLSPTSPAIDYVPKDQSRSNAEQRGRHFKRVFNYGDPADDMGAMMDVGAVEVQIGTFVVDILADQSNGQYSDVGGGSDPYTFGNFSLREALLFSSLNPEENDVINFEGLPTANATITVSLGALVVDTSVIIEGPENWILTVNALDPTPLTKNSDGSRVFEIDDGSAMAQKTVSISSLVISGADFAGNGGGIFNREDLTLSGLTIRNNGASLRGGGVYVQQGSLTIDGTTINNNRAGDDGGGIYIDGAATLPEVHLFQSTISGNIAADRGAGITNNGGHLVIEYSTINRNNSGSTLASGIVNFQANAKTELFSTIVSGNVNNDLGFFSGATATTFVSNGYNLVGNGTPGVIARFTAVGDKPNILDPKLDPLSVTGGLVATHRPQAGSPVIDMGDPMAEAGLDGVPEFDQRGEGFPRIYVDPDGLSTPRIDIGAYELQPRLLTVDLAGDSDNGIYTVGNLTLREAVKIANLNPQADTIAFDISMLGSGPLNVGELTITDHLKILGPGSGVLSIAASAGGLFQVNNNNASLLEVTISGLELRDATTGAIHSRENLRLDDITFVNNQSATHGGALFHEIGSLTITHSLLTGNKTTAADADGGAIYLTNTTANFDDVTVAGNRTSVTGGDGGGIALVNAVLTGNQLTVSGNTGGAASSRGGGMFAQNSTVTFTEFGVVSGNNTTGSSSLGGGLASINSTITFGPNSLINLNSTVGSQALGGGVYISGGTLNLNTAQMAQNSTSGQLSSGGAIYATGLAHINLNSVVMRQNFVSGQNSFGGGIANIGAVIVVRDSLIAENEARHAQAKGGGVYSDTNLSTNPALKEVTTIVNSTISGNMAPLRGGGIFNADGLTEIKQSTITNNASGAINLGSGVASFGNASTTKTSIYSTIVAGNAGATALSPTGSDVDFVDSPFQNSFESLGYNLIGNGNALSVFNKPGDQTGKTNPMLGPLADNTNDPNAAFPMLTHELLPGSPAINAGDPAFNASAYSPSLNTDQRGIGFARKLAGRIDIGAFESALSPLVPADFDGDSDVDGSDFLTWQRNLGKPNATLADGDANSDGSVNGADLSIWKTNFGTGPAPAASAFVAALQAADLSAAADYEADDSAQALAAAALPFELAMLGVPGGSSSDDAFSPDAGQVADSGSAPAVDASFAELSTTPASQSTRSSSEWADADFDADSSDDLADGNLEDAVFAAWGEELL